jgi:clan AA aspartic protease
MENEMGKVTEEITLVNAGDKVRVEAGVLKEARKVTVEAVVDTGASTLIISENVRQKLGLAVEGKRRTHFANGMETECSLTEPVQIHWKDRLTFCPAVVIPDAKSTLLGAIPLEGMDLLVDPVNQRLVGAHGDTVVALAL